LWLSDAPDGASAA